MQKTSTLRNPFDERLFDGIRARSHYCHLSREAELTLGHYVAEARRSGWTWSLIAYALKRSPSVARRLYGISVAFTSGRVIQ